MENVNDAIDGMFYRIDGQSEVHQARTALIETILRHKKAEATYEDVTASADAYIAAIKAHAKATGRKMPIPNRGYLIRTMTY